MRKILWSFVLLVACHTSEEYNATTNRWSDERLWPVLEAQEHRDVQKLCTLLKDADPVLREAAALAFASVQDSASVPCLVRALQDPAATVRINAAYALGFVADSNAVRPVALAAISETDTNVRRAFLNASFLGMQRNNMLNNDARTVLYYLEHAHGYERVHAADVLRRLPDSIVSKLGAEINALMAREGAEVRAFLILAMRKLGAHADRSLLEKIAADPEASPEERVCAIRVLGRSFAGKEADLFVELLMDPRPVVRSAALGELEKLSCPLPTAPLSVLLSEVTDPMRWVPVYGLLQRCTPEEGAPFTRHGLGADAGPYAKAAMIRAGADPGSMDQVEFMVLDSALSYTERQAAFEEWISLFNERLKNVEIDKRSRDEAHGSFITSVLRTGDAGLIAAACEQLQAGDSAYLRKVLTDELVGDLFMQLHPIRDLETRILLGQVVAKRDGLPTPTHERPRFNHSIDKAKLRALKQGQQYLIVTNKGEFIIATDVNECPGSSLAFDSLVTAGYYNGKYFHRVIPNFVVQGGCPRGDGYGGMPWTLRTEIGRSLFTAGSVGLASAGPDTESCQFFITHTATPHLDGRYTRFGEVVSGMDVVWNIQVGDVMTRVERLP